MLFLPGTDRVIKVLASPKAFAMYNPVQCPCCKKETMQTVLRFNRRGPRAGWEIIAKIYWNALFKNITTSGGQAQLCSHSRENNKAT